VPLHRMLHRTLRPSAALPRHWDLDFRKRLVALTLTLALTVTLTLTLNLP